MKLDDFSMNGDPRIEQLEAANQQLQEGLKACHELVAQYRSKLAANQNDPPRLGDSGRPNSDTASS